MKQTVYHNLALVTPIPLSQMITPSPQTRAQGFKHWFVYVTSLDITDLHTSNAIWFKSLLTRQLIAVEHALVGVMQ